MNGYMRLLSPSRILVLCLGLTLVICIYQIAFLAQDGERCLCTKAGDSRKPTQPLTMISAEGRYKPYESNHTLGIIVPLRDRFEELMEFVPHMHSFLDKQKVRHRIFAVNQIDNYRFNRASLINVGFLKSSLICDYIAMHDVDLLPMNPDLSYSYPLDGAFHVAAPELHPLYHYKTFVGGILLVKSSDFSRLNGLSNRYWGWGREDDEFYVRMKKLGISLKRPEGITTGDQTFKHVHDRKRRPRDNKRYFDQRNKTRKLDKVTGVTTVQFDIVSMKEMTIDGAPVTIVNVKLKCDVTLTPWCLQPEDHDWYLQNYPQEIR